MNWTVETLFGLKGDEFEFERNRIISSYIKSLPEDKRHTVYAMQCQIDLERINRNDADFAQWLNLQLVENLENLGDQMVRLKSILTGPPR